MRPGIRALSGLLSRFTSLCRAIRRVIPVPLLRRYRALMPRNARLAVQRWSFRHCLAIGKLFEQSLPSRLALHIAVLRAAVRRIAIHPHLPGRMPSAERRLRRLPRLRLASLHAGDRAFCAVIACQCFAVQRLTIRLALLHQIACVTFVGKLFIAHQ